MERKKPMVTDKFYTRKQLKSLEKFAEQVKYRKYFYDFEMYSLWIVVAFLYFLSIFLGISKPDNSGFSKVGGEIKFYNPSLNIWLQHIIIVTVIYVVVFSLLYFIVGKQMEKVSKSYINNEETTIPILSILLPFTIEMFLMKLGSSPFWLNLAYPLDVIEAYGFNISLTEQALFSNREVQKEFVLEKIFRDSKEFKLLDLNGIEEYEKFILDKFLRLFESMGSYNTRELKLNVIYKRDLTETINLIKELGVPKNQKTLPLEVDVDLLEDYYLDELYTNVNGIYSKQVTKALDEKIVNLISENYKGSDSDSSLFKKIRSQFLKASDL